MQRNFVTTLSNKGATDDQKATLATYKGLDRFDARKTALLDSWAKDKSCKWYAETETKEERSTSTGGVSANGYGTKCPTQKKYMCIYIYI
jgi:hypothetical protein